MSKQQSPTIIIVTIIIAIVSGVGLWMFFLKPTNNNFTTSSYKKPPARQTVEEPKTIRFIAVGDMLPHDTINNLAKKSEGGYEYSPMFQNMKPFFDKADIKFCNQSVLGGGELYGISGYPLFNAPIEFTIDMGELGCNLINTASNHSSDKNQDAIDATIGAWSQVPNVLAVAGTNSTPEGKNTIKYFTKNGLKFAFLAYTTYTNKPPINDYGVNMFSREFASLQLDEARKNADMIIVSMRWGTEYSSQITAFQSETAQFLADNGADIVLGHGPHVLQPVATLVGTNDKKTLVWYSLGNFINSQLDIETLFNGIAVMDIDVATKSVSSISFLPIYMHYEWTPQEKAKGDLLKRKNAMLYTLDQAEEPLKLSQNKTTVQEQRARISDVLNKMTTVKILNDSNY